MNSVKPCLKNTSLSHKTFEFASLLLLQKLKEIVHSRQTIKCAPNRYVLKGIIRS
jgi:hypothetical protein